MLNEQNSQLKEENLKLSARLKEQEEEKMALSAEQVSHGPSLRVPRSLFEQAREFEMLAQHRAKVAELDERIRMLESEKETNHGVLESERAAHREERDRLIRQIEELRDTSAVDTSSLQPQLSSPFPGSVSTHDQDEGVSNDNGVDTAEMATSLSRLQERYDRLADQHLKLQDVAQSMRGAQAKFKEQSRKHERLLISLMNAVKSDELKVGQLPAASASQHSVPAPDDEMDLADSPRAEIDDADSGEERNTPVAADALKEGPGAGHAISTSMQACLDEIRGEASTSHLAALIG